MGQAIGRLGCFAAGCCWGVKCDRAWAVKFTSHDANKITGVPLDIEIHPTQLYEAGLLGLTFLITWRLFLRPHRPGFVFGAYLILAAGHLAPSDDYSSPDTAPTPEVRPGTVE